MNRRTLLAAGAMLPLAAAGCGEPEEAPEAAPQSDTQRRADLELLGQILEVKLGAVRSYAAAQRHLGGRLEPFAAFEARHAERLVAEIGARGGRPPRAAGDFPSVRARRSALQSLVDAEEVSVAVLLDALPKLAGADLRVMAAGMLAVEAQQLSVLQDELGRTRLADAFVYGRAPW